MQKCFNQKVGEASSPPLPRLYIGVVTYICGFCIDCGHWTQGYICDIPISDRDPLVQRQASSWLCAAVYSKENSIYLEKRNVTIFSKCNWQLLKWGELPWPRRINTTNLLTFHQHSVKHFYYRAQERPICSLFAGSSIIEAWVWVEAWVYVHCP